MIVRRSLHARYCASPSLLHQSVRRLCSCRPPHSATADRHATSAPVMELDSQLQQLIVKLHANDSKAVVYVTGGAVQAISWLLSVPGASNTILECSVPYARDSLVDMLGHEPDQFCSERTAADMAVAAYRRAAQLTEFGSHILGVAATCSLATVPLKRGLHHAFIACHDGLHGTHVTGITLAKGARSRVGEDALTSMALVQLLAQTAGVDTSSFTLPLPPPQSAVGQQANGHLPHNNDTTTTPLNGDTHTATHHTPSAEAAPAANGIAAPPPAATASSDSTRKISQCDVVYRSHYAMGDPLEELIAGRVRCVEFAGGRVVVDAPRRHKIYLSGSFNPLHKGHIGLVQAAARTKPGLHEAAFELSIGNADKGMLSLAEVRRRVHQFTSADLPLVVTSAPLFTIKATLLPSSCFVVGYDTAVRMVMPKYYDDSELNMLLDFEKLRHAGCSFIVAGRKDTSTGRFNTLEDVQVPPSLKDLFHGMGEDEFRVDLSSTELRARSQL